MSSVRNELALANAQELINVRSLFFLPIPLPPPKSYPCQCGVLTLPLTKTSHTENKRQMLCKMCDQTVHLSF